jgi:predicted TIM-barrel fold metal-dependent hydrolase
MPIIDTHQHLWDLKQFPLTWVKGSTTLDRDFLMSDYVKATAGLNVVRSVYMEVAVEPKQHEEEAEWAVATCRRGGSPMVAAVISGRPASDGFKAYLERFKKNPEIKGLRQVLHGPETPPGYCLDRSFIRGIQRLGELGLSFDLCVRSTDLRDGAKLVDACPNTAFILDHCGNADVRAKDRAPWRADIAAIARRPNIVCKVSGIVASTAGQPWSADDLAPIVNHVLDVFGPDRVVFGGDWPVCLLGATYKQWVDALKAIVRNRSEAEQRKLFHDNAVRVYRLG